jgi:hypothetical protein
MASDRVIHHVMAKSELDEFTKIYAVETLSFTNSNSRYVTESHAYLERFRRPSGNRWLRTQRTSDR